MAGARRRTHPAARTVLPAVLAVAAAAVLQRLGRTYGSTPAERAARLPGDHVVPSPEVVTDHAVTIAAPPSAVWPWLVQMGWGRGGWYTARWVDRLLFPANGPSADVVVPDLQDVAVGDFIPDGPPASGCGLVVEELAAERALVLHSTTHVPPRWRDRVTADWSWAFVLTPQDGGTRFHFRSRWVTSPWWFRAGVRLVLVPADLVMSRQMLTGVRRRAEGLAAARAEAAA